MKTTQPEPTTAAELEAALSGYIGTEHYFTSPTFGTLGLRYTDGIRAMAEIAGAYWLLDTIHSAAIYNPQFKSGFWSVRMESQDDKGRLLITFDFQDDGTPIDSQGNLGKADFSQEFDYTDFPEGAFNFYILDGVILLTSEY